MTCLGNRSKGSNTTSDLPLALVDALIRLTHLDTVSDVLVLGVGSIPSIGHVPLVETEGSTWLQALVDLSVDTLEGRSVASSLNSVDWNQLDSIRTRELLTSIEGVLSEGLAQLHEVTLLERDSVAQTSLGGLLGSSVDLEIVVVDTDNGSIGESSNLTSGSTNTTTDIEDLHTGSDVDLSSEVVFLSCELIISR